jgi:hypothetical protein
MKNKYLKTGLFSILMVQTSKKPAIIDRKPAIALQTQLTSINKIPLGTLFKELVNVWFTDYLFDRTGEIVFW